MRCELCGKGLCLLKSLKVRERRECSAMEGSHSAVWVGRLLSDLKGYHVEGTEALFYVTQRTEVRQWVAVSGKLI